ncbi:hypothetical protein NM208_g1367 [Fusarium decemcellulare]|uniref:Uncharacterized protein n=1 Tax=Fusarium decemcellulare TaxID=57161 RepID=A0ACC1SWE6_9HYPO|nr:hypothetical protein NM208_g1367 [Fusarium decemcellulare]
MAPMILEAIDDSAATPNSKLNIKIAIDRGGTFTDCLGIVEGREQNILVKILSQDPSNYPDAPIEGIRRILEQATGKRFPRDTPIDTSQFQNLSIRMGTTVATNALLERKGERVALLITEGFSESLRIGLQSRPKLFELKIVKPDVLYEKVVEVGERVTVEGYQQSPSHDEDVVAIDKALPSDPDLVRGLNGQVLRILKRLDKERVRADLQKLYDDGFRSICVCLAHSYTFQDHELEIQNIANEIGIPHVTLSCLTLPMIKMISRGMSATADAYLTPVVQQYIKGFQSGFSDNLQSSNTRCELMQSDGGLTDLKRFSGLRAVLSGPAGGVVGHARTSFHPEENTPVIGFDMGGTSTDVSRFDGSFEHTFENMTAGITIMAPQLDINTVAAGGGSILFWRHGLFAVGPDSAGAHPGPACYRKGGPLTISDANAFTGRLLPEYFPKIFGESENEPLDVTITRKKFTELAEQISQETGQKKTPEEVAMGFLDVANETMAKPVRALTEARGFDTSAHHLACFGGAGGQHACAIAASLSIRRVIIHRYSSILSAYGMTLADTVHEAQRPASGVFTTAATVQSTIDELRAEVTRELRRDGIPKDCIKHEVYLNLRYKGTDNSLMILEPHDGDYLAEFTRQHFREYSFTFPDKQVLLEDIRVRGIGQSRHQTNESPYKELGSVSRFDVSQSAEDCKSPVYFSQTGWSQTPVYRLETLRPGCQVQGPAIIIDNTQTIVVEPSVQATILSRHVILDLPSTKSRELSRNTIDPISLSIFGHRFMSIAEQMGRTFQKTSVSTNIKERLDFSCALFSPEGRLVANAPHVPVHLGSMEYAVRYQNEKYRSELKPGDVLCSNHPIAGGVHLPDITIMTPIWDEAGRDIIFWVASRGHHPDVGGISPGSMPSNSKFLYEEGAATASYKIVSGGRFNETETRKFLYDEPSKYEGCSGTRNWKDNLSDLRAAIAANRKGAVLIDTLIQEFSLPVVHMYMNAIAENAETAVRAFLRETARKLNGRHLSFKDYLDDGSVIKLEIRIDAEAGTAGFDFTGTSEETLNCLNAPKAITHSCVIYSLRCLINMDIPLNQGCLAPIRVTIPQGTILNPSPYAAVCAGNSITSQRITDVILGAFGASAASQGCVNVFGFGIGGKDTSGKEVPGFGYIETIAGGHGAGPDWAGTSGVHTNMSNTRCSDPEEYELRYPVILRQWTLRPGSGGRGRFNGGDGCVRDVEFRIPLQVSMLSERRVMRPYGMQGGEPGAAGKNLYVKKEEDGTWRTINIGGKMELSVSPGERVIINTPGGGGWGIASDKGTNGVMNNGTNGSAPPRLLVTAEYVKSLEERISQFESGAAQSHSSPRTAAVIGHQRHSSASTGPHVDNDNARRLSHGGGRDSQDHNLAPGSPSTPAAAYSISGLVPLPTLHRDSFYQADSETPLLAISPPSDVSQASGLPVRSHLSQDVENLLLNTYKERAQAQYPFLDWNTFLSWHAEWKASSDPPQRPWLGFFVNLVYSTSLLLLSWPGADAINAQVFYNKGIGLLKHVLDQKNPILGAQAHLLLGVHALHSCSTQRLMSAAVNAMRYCIHEHFHLAEAEPAPVDASTRLEVQFRRRCFWSAYNLDRMVMGSLDMPHCIPDAMITVKLYANIDDEDLIAAAQQTPPELELTDSSQFTCVSTPLHILQCRRIQSEMALYTLRWDYETNYKDSPEWRIRILTELENYKARAQSFSDPQSKGHTSQRWLAMIYHYTLLMLYRPTKESVLGPAGDWSIQASSQACLIFRKCQRDRQTAQSWMGLICQFQSGITLLYCFWATPPEYRTENYDTPDVTDALRACSNILAIMADQWPKADCLRDVFELLAHEVPLVDRPGRPPTRMSQSSVGAIRNIFPQVRTLVIHRSILRMIEEMITEDFPRIGSSNGPSRPPRSSTAPRDERAAVLTTNGSGLDSISSGFEMPFSVSQQDYDLERQVGTLNTDELLAFPGVFNIDDWT